MYHAKGLAMNDLDFAALLVSRVCHDLVSPVGAVVNGLEVLEDETDPAMRADALRLVAASAEQAAARLQFARIAFGAAGSAGAELDLTEVSNEAYDACVDAKVCRPHDPKSSLVNHFGGDEAFLRESAAARRCIAACPAQKAGQGRPRAPHQSQGAQ